MTDFIPFDETVNAEQLFSPGDIVYFVDYDHTNGKGSIGFGRVYAQYNASEVCIDLLERRETRRIDGVPLDEYPNSEHYGKRCKLPKGWTYNTPLYELVWEEDPEWNEFAKSAKITDPESVKYAYERGLLVKASCKFHGEISTDVNKEGFCVCLKYPTYHHVSVRKTLQTHKVYRTYQEAVDEQQVHAAELARIASLSDEEWAVEDALRIVRRYTTNEAYANEVVRWLRGMENYGDIEMRFSNLRIQWKYWKNRRWNELPEFENVPIPWTS